MNQIKRAAGVLWLLLSLGAAYYCIGILGLPKFATGKQDDLVFGIIILFVLTPIIVGGLFTFGLYAVQGDYSSDK